MNNLWFVCFIFFLSLSGYTQEYQKVGIVLSGGGAKGAAHVGFLKALEENNIPIDYIAGTSAGSIVGGLYASGYSPDEILHILSSEDFVNMVLGKFEDKNTFYFKQDDPNANWLSFKLSTKGKISDLIPTNLISTLFLDFELMRMVAPAEAAANYNFDSLFIPFRCVAADISNNEPYVFKEGNLSEAIRASSTYPFYVKPIRVNNRLMFDGGMYNNFPSDIIYDEFLPDIILGSNVSANPKEPSEDDLLSQIESMLMFKTNYSALCENGIVIKPNTRSIGLWGFSKAEEAANLGYEATMRKMDQIKASVSSRISAEDRAGKRQKFKQKFKPLKFENLEINGLNKYQSIYVKKSLLGNRKKLSVDFLRKNYYKIFSDDKIDFIFPKSYFDTHKNSYTLKLNVKKEKDFIIGIGGSFSSRPVTTGMISAKYNYLNLFSTSLIGNYYFGRFYNSALLKARMDIPLGLPFFIEPEFNYSKTDFFRSQNYIFEDQRPSFFVQYERFGRLNLGLPVSKRGKLRIGYSFGKLTDEYYQIKSFSQTDTSDITNFYFSSPYVLYERSSLNEKQYANSGTLTSLSLRFVSGEEIHNPGTTSLSDTKYAKLHDWFQFRFNYENYYKKMGRLGLGFFTELYYSNQPQFNNYASTILRARPFRPTVESNVLFLETFRSNQYLTVGHKFLFEINNNLEFRLEGYIFQPYQRIVKADNRDALVLQNFDKRFAVASACLVAKTPLGPISFSSNYYHNVPEVANETKTPLTFFFHFGYILFNRKALE